MIVVLENWEDIGQPLCHRVRDQCFSVVHCVAFSMGETNCLQGVGPWSFLNKVSVLGHSPCTHVHVKSKIYSRVDILPVWFLC